MTKKDFFQLYSPQISIKAKRIKINHIYQLLNALSPQRLLKRGFALITDEKGNCIYSVKSLNEKDKLLVQLSDGNIMAEVRTINYDKV